ncbi:MAG TPA: hypothetical protein VFD65_03905 [Chitinophagales bacterium]|nr:hypothetical protein [Chitinophagales bacterium]
MSLSEILNKNVRRNNHYHDVVSLLVYGELPESSGKKSTKIFSDIKDLIVFAALIGERYQLKEEVDTKNSTGITLQTFSGAGSSKNSRVHQHNIIFMMSLFTYEDMNMIRDENVDKAIHLFEQYSNGGLGQIKKWLIDSAWNPLSLLDRIVDALPESNIGKAPEMVDFS